MAVTTDILEIIVKLRDTASRGVGKLGKSITGVKNRVGRLTRSFTGLRGAIAGLVGTAAIGLLARSFIKAADAAEGYRVRLSVLLGSQKEANALFEDMADFAANVSFQYEEVMGTATALSGVMEGGREEIAKWMPVLSDLTAASGLTMEEASSNFIRMYSAGAAAADSFRDKGILAMLGFQAKTQYTAEQTRAMLMKAWEDPVSKFRGAAGALAKTWSGLLSMMGDRWFQFRLKVMEQGGLIDYFKAVVTVYLEWTDKLKKEGKLDEWAQRVADSVINIFETTLLTAAAFYDAIKPVLHAFKVILGSVIDVWKKLPPWLQQVGIVVAVLGGVKVAAAVAGLSHLYNMTKNIAKGLGLMSAGVLKFSDFSEMNFEELDNFITDFDAQLKEAGEAAGESGEAAMGDIEGKVTAFLARLHEIRAQMKAERDAAEAGDTGGPRITPPKIDTKLLNAQIKAEASTILEENKTMLAELDLQWDEHKVSLIDYFKERTRLIEVAYEAQKDALEKQLAMQGGDPAKAEALKASLFALEQAHARTMIQLQGEINGALETEGANRKALADIMAGIDERLLASRAAGGGLAAQFEQETQSLMTQQREDMEALLDLKQQGVDVELAMNAAKNKHIEEQDALSTKQRKQVFQTYMDSVQQSLGDMTSMFSEWYKASGSKSKEMFNLYKAASIAETIIGTYSSAQKAYDSMAKIHPALGAAAAAVAIASGMARVALIRQQQMAAGGKVLGWSPHPRADNIPINATAGEFMHPVDTVKHYGVRAMEAIRRKLVPRELLEQFASGMHMPAVRMPAMNYAAGGPVAAAAMAGGNVTNLDLSVPVNLPENLSFIGRRLEAEIEPVVLRVIQEELKY